MLFISVSFLCHFFYLIPKHTHQLQCYSIKIVMKNQQLLDRKIIAKIVSERTYREKQLNQNYKLMCQLINGVNGLDFKENSFKIIRILIRYFRFPILILFKPFFDRLEKQKRVLLEFIEDQKTTGGIVMKILNGRQFPSLDFYTRAGYNKDIALEESKENIDFMLFFQRYEGLLYQVVGDKQKQQIDRLKFILNELNTFRNSIKFDPIFLLCIEAYEKMAMDKKTQIEAMLQTRPEKVDMQRQMGQPQKIFIQQGGNIKAISDAKIDQDYLCCRPYFYLNEVINQPETLTQQYKSYKYPYNRFLNETLLKTITGFLNGKGGIIYIGVQENNDSKKRLVKGQYYNESVKEDVLKHFRYLCQRISPEIVNNQLYRLEYIPVRDEKGFMPGEYVIRLRISKGQKGQLYSFKNYDNDEYVAFRTANQVLLRRLSQQILELYRRKLLQPQEQEQVNHPGPCKRPQTGQPAYQISKEKDSSSSASRKWVEKKKVPTYKEREPTKQLIGYLFIGKDMGEQLQKYSHTSYKRLQVVQPALPERDMVRALIETSGMEQDFIPLSLRLTFQQEYFDRIWKAFQASTVLTTTEKCSRTTLLFNSIKQAAVAASILLKLNFPFAFAMPTK